MKILVDEMPKYPYDCPYCVDNCTMDSEEYKCKWRDCNRDCWETKDCPFFMEIGARLKNIEDYIEEQEAIKDAHWDEMGYGY